MPKAIYSSPSSLDAKRDQSCTQSTRGIHIHAFVARTRARSARSFTQRLPRRKSNLNTSFGLDKEAKTAMRLSWPGGGNPRMTC